MGRAGRGATAAVRPGGHPDQRRGVTLTVEAPRQARQRGGSDRRRRWALSALGVAALLAVLVPGLLLLAGPVAGAIAGVVGHGFLVSLGAGVAWFVAVAVAIRLVVRRLPELRWPLRGAYLAVAFATTAVIVLTSVGTKTVNEQVATGVPRGQTGAASAPGGGAPPGGGAASVPSGVNVEVAAGSFGPLDESVSGRAAVVRLASGSRVLTFTDFSSSAGPDIHVYLVAGPVRHASDVRSFRDLGTLKGNRGNQQYEVPGDVDLSAYPTVVIFCKPFDIALGAATLTAE